MVGQDSLRAIKAVPVARYFLDLRQSFTEMLRILSPGGLAVVVSGKTSTFYQFATRNALFVVNSAELLADEAQRAGFEVEALHDIKLFKSNANARPRSLDDYYENIDHVKETSVKEQMRRRFWSYSFIRKREISMIECSVRRRFRILA